MANNRNRKRGFGPINLTSPGTVFTLGFISLAIGFGVLLGRGVTPHYRLTDPGPQAEYEIEETTPIPSQKGLQLKTLKFKECGTTTAVSLQVDITGSMNPYMGDIREAVLSFTSTLSDSSVIGIQSYNSSSPRTTVIPISYYSEVKTQIEPRVLGWYAVGGTPSYDALIYSGELLKEAIPKFPDRKFNYIFFSDGDPNVGPSTDQEIAQAAQTIKDQGVTVYAIGLGNVKPNTIQVIATDPDKAIIVRSSADLQKVYKEIAQRICTSQTTPTPKP